MRRIDRSTLFRRDYKRESRGERAGSLEGDLGAILKRLAEDTPLDVRHRDHALIGHWRGCRECHIRPDLLLIYRKIDADILQLARLGSHSELFGK